MAMGGARRVRPGLPVLLMAMLLAAIGLGGCSLLTPSRAEVQRERTAAKVGSDALVSDGVLTVALDTADAPQGVIASDGSVTGYYADVASVLAQHLGLSVSFVDAGGPSSVLTGGKADIFLGAVASDASDSVTVFGDCLEDASAVFVRSDDAGALTASALSSMTVGVQGSSAAQDALNEAGISAAQETYSNANECFEALESGEIDCAVCDATAGAYLSRVYADISFAGTIDAVHVLGVAALDGNDELIDQVADALDALASDGTLDAVHAAWYGALPSTLSDTLLEGIQLSTSTATKVDGATLQDEARSEAAEIDDAELNRLG